MVFLARPTIASRDAPAIQVLGTASALAARGVTAHVLHDGDGDLARHGVAPSPQLRLHRLRRGLLGAVAWRALAVGLSARAGARVLARDWRRLDALPWLRAPVVFEVHDLPTVDAAPDARAAAVALEARVLARVVGVVAVSEGALARLRDTHGRVPPARVVPNGAAAGPVADGPGEGVGYVGSARAFKGLDDLADAARIGRPITLVGPDADDPLVRAAIARSGGRLTVEPPLDPVDVPARLRRFRVLVLPLSPGVFGDALTSPLKLWDYLAAGRPIAAADRPTVTAAAPGATIPYRTGDPADLAAAIARAWDAPPPAVAPRTWGDRADELLAFFDELAR